MVANRGPSAYHPNALPLGQTSSHEVFLVFMCVEVVGGGGCILYVIIIDYGHNHAH